MWRYFRRELANPRTPASRSWATRAEITSGPSPLPTLYEVKGIPPGGWVIDRRVEVKNNKRPRLQ